MNTAISIRTISSSLLQSRQLVSLSRLQRLPIGFSLNYPGPSVF